MAETQKQTPEVPNEIQIRNAKEALRMSFLNNTPEDVGENKKLEEFIDQMLTDISEDKLSGEIHTWISNFAREYKEKNKLETDQKLKENPDYKVENDPQFTEAWKERVQQIAEEWVPKQLEGIREEIKEFDGNSERITSILPLPADQKERFNSETKEEVTDPAEATRRKENDDREAKINVVVDHLIDGKQIDEFKDQLDQGERKIVLQLYIAKMALQDFQELGGVPELSTITDEQSARYEKIHNFKDLTDLLSDQKENRKIVEFFQTRLEFHAGHIWPTFDEQEGIGPLVDRMMDQFAGRAIERQKIVILERQYAFLFKVVEEKKFGDFVVAYQSENSAKALQEFFSKEENKKLRDSFQNFQSEQSKVRGNIEDLNKFVSGSLREEIRSLPLEQKQKATFDSLVLADPESAHKLMEYTQQNPQSAAVVLESIDLYKKDYHASIKSQEGKFYVQFETLPGATAPMEAPFRLLNDQETKEGESPYILESFSTPTSPFFVKNEDIPKAMQWHTYFTMIHEALPNTAHEILQQPEGEKLEGVDIVKLEALMRQIEGIASSEPIRLTEKSVAFWDNVGDANRVQTKTNNDQIEGETESDKAIEREIFAKQLAQLQNPLAGSEIQA